MHVNNVLFDNITVQVACISYRKSLCIVFCSQMNRCYTGAVAEGEIGASQSPFH